ncbi:hypothetical protein DPMN_065670 [Dreissena polymorpha]|uniref:Uncharacterized protein n=1 Tax=Dreissena polymorpha TaxID=45954 RepID=A0A9D3YWD9_DREPO|nr:hypothetical protein DPMN_065670 [Dreissena polymorpha]
MAATEKTLEALANRIMDLDYIIEKNHDKHVSVTAEDTYSFVESKKNSNTKKKTNSDVKRLKDWLGREDQEQNF